MDILRDFQKHTTQEEKEKTLKNFIFWFLCYTTYPFPGFQYKIIFTEKYSRESENLPNDTDQIFYR